jgi:hypothetical protein
LQGFGLRGGSNTQAGRQCLPAVTIGQPLFRVLPQVVVATHQSPAEAFGQGGRFQLGLVAFDRRLPLLLIAETRRGWRQD